MSKRNKILIIVGILISIIPLFFYFYNFNGDLSNKSSDWSAFGSYVGGIYAPLFSLFSVIILIITLLEMQENNKKQYNSNNREKKLNDMKWLAELLRETFNKNPEHQASNLDFYFRIKLLLERKMAIVDIRNKSEVEHQSYYLMQENNNFFKNELLIFETLISRLSKEDDEDLQKLLVIVITSKLSSEERYWISYYARTFGSEEVVAWLNKWPNFSAIPPSLRDLIKSGSY